MSLESAPNPAELLRQEIERLIANREKTQAPFIREALEQKIAHLQKRLAKLEAQKKEEPAEEEAVLEPPTPKQLQEADGYVRQARVEKMRGNAQAATEMLRKAAEAAPSAPAVLEALADDLVERKQRREAIVLYKRALKLDPKNVGLERKHAMLVLGSSAGGMSIEEALSTDWGGGVPPGEGLASPLAVVLLSLFLPGLGHILLGKTTTGAVILGLWAVCTLWLLLMAHQVQEFLHMMFGKGGHPNYVVLVPVFGLAAIYVITLSGLRGPRQTYTRLKADHPQPPVNLPFE